MRRPGVRSEVQRIERDEAALLDAILKARCDAGLTQAQVAERMGTQAPAVARLERALATGKHSPSIFTLRKYVQACGKRLVLKVAWLHRVAKNPIPFCSMPNGIFTAIEVAQ
jgi:transcriptional regulator with XRE-family HTH domain